jgi:C_GCAxxG_C_C family probable redox protein
MEADVKRLHELLTNGYCCSSVLVQMGLELKGEENKQLVETMSCLCGGVQNGLLCGALTGGACMMNLIAPENANREMVKELVEWFADFYERKYGGINCEDIIGDNPSNRVHCSQIVEETYLKAKMILSDYGHLLE